MTRSVPVSYTHLDIVRARHDQPVDDDTLADAVEARWRLDEYTVDAQTVVERSELADELRDALVRLPATYRSAVVLHDVEGLSLIHI